MSELYTKRTKKIIDKKFQYRMTFSIIGLVYLLTSLVIGAIIVNATYNNQKLTEISKKQDKFINKQKSTITNLIAMQKDKSITATSLAKKSNEDIKIIQENVSIIQKIAVSNNILLYGIIAFILLQGFILYIILIEKTHRISGPLHIISGYVKDITEGKIPRVRPIRSKDEFQEFHNQIIKMVESLKEKNYLK